LLVGIPVSPAFRGPADLGGVAVPERVEQTETEQSGVWTALLTVH
jgi:hypothetical protein